MNSKRLRKAGGFLGNSFSAGRIWIALKGVQQGQEMSEEVRREMLSFLEHCEAGREASRSSMQEMLGKMDAVRIYQEIFEPVVDRVEDSRTPKDYLDMARGLSGECEVDVKSLTQFFYKMMDYSSVQSRICLRGERFSPRSRVA